MPLTMPRGRSHSSPGALKSHHKCIQTAPNNDSTYVQMPLLEINSKCRSKFLSKCDCKTLFEMPLKTAIKMRLEMSLKMHSICVLEIRLTCMKTEVYARCVLSMLLKSMKNVPGQVV